MELKHFKGCKSLEEVKIKYRVLSKRHHPDKGGDPKIMQEVNAENDYIKKNGLPVPGEKVKIKFEGFAFEFNNSHGVTQEIVDRAMIEFERFIDKKNPLLRSMLKIAFQQYIKTMKK